MSTPLTTRIPIKDRNGNIVDHKEVATYAGLLATAHEQGLRRIITELVRSPNEYSDLAIVHATVETDKGVFTGIGDASSDNVNRRIAPHLIRMAETRAKARALRDAVNIGIVALEELGGDLVEDEHQPRGEVRPFRRNDEPPMSEAQRRLLFRLLSRSGYRGEQIKAVICEEAGVSDLAQVSKRLASTLIDSWKQEGARA